MLFPGHVRTRMARRERKISVPIENCMQDPAAKREPLASFNIHSLDAWDADGTGWAVQGHVQPDRFFLSSSAAGWDDNYERYVHLTIDRRCAAMHRAD